MIVVEFNKPGSGTAKIGIDDNITYTVKNVSSSTTITSGTLNAGDTTLDLGGVKLELKKRAMRLYVMMP